LAACSGVSAIAFHTLLKVLVSPRNRSRFMSSIYLIGYRSETTSVRDTHSSAPARAFQKSASLDFLAIQLEFEFKSSEDFPKHSPVRS
jgi:hypothetical protein